MDLNYSIIVNVNLICGYIESATGEKQYYKNLQHNGKKLNSYHGIYAEDYFSTKDGSTNLSFYTDTNGNKDNNFNSVNIEEGTI